MLSSLQPYICMSVGSLHLANTPKRPTRYIDVSFTEAAARRGGLGERVTLPAFLACQLLHSDGVALGLLERVPVDGYADRLVREAGQAGNSTSRFPTIIAQARQALSIKAKAIKLRGQTNVVA